MGVLRRVAGVRAVLAAAGVRPVRQSSSSGGAGGRAGVGEEATPHRAAGDRAAVMMGMTSSRSVLGFEMRLITPEQPLYRATADELDALETGEPWWAFCWPGSFALAELLREQPELARGKRVLDVATGCGISAFASLQAGAAHVIANDIDPWSLDAVRLNVSLAEDEAWAAGAEQEGRLSYCVDDLIGSDVVAEQQIDVVIAGDICYEQPLADQVHTWLHRCVFALK